MDGLSTTPKKHRLADRGEDLYETPPEAVHALLKVEKLPTYLWEPCAGRGAIVDVLRGAGHIVLASDLTDYGDPTHFAGRDFLMEWKAPDKCECIVTNPPYKLATQFVRHGLRLCPKVVMLLRLAFLEGSARSDVIDGNLARVYVFRNRLPMMHRDGWAGNRVSSSIAFAWFVFEQKPKGAITLDRITWEKSDV
jgi:hypothetical protein